MFSAAKCNEISKTGRFAGIRRYVCRRKLGSLPVNGYERINLWKRQILNDFNINDLTYDKSQLFTNAMTNAFQTAAAAIPVPQ